MPNDAEMRFVATLQDDTSPQLDKLAKKLKEMGASPAEIKMTLKAVDQATPQIAAVQKQMDSMPSEMMVTIKASIDDVQSKLSDLQKSTDAQPMHLNFVDNIDQISSKLFNLRTKINLPIGGVLGGTGLGQVVGVGGAGALAGAAAAGGIGLMQQGVQYNSQMEQSMVTLTQTLKDSASASQEMGKLVTFAQKTPFNYQDVMAADVRLRSYQIPAMKGEGGPNNQGWLSAAGNMAAGMSTPITQAVEAIADARQGYFVRMMSYGIRMMKEDFQAGGKYAGLSYEQGTERAIRRFEGSMEMQSKTFQGLTSNLHDIFQQQVLGPIGKVPFDAAKQVASSAYDALSDPKTLQKIGMLMQDIQHKQEAFVETVKQGKTMFMAYMYTPLQQITQQVVALGTTFGKAFGGVTGSVLKTIGSALLGISGLVTGIASQVPGLAQFFGTMKALSLLGFTNISDPFLNLAKSINPLTFSITGLLRSLIQMPGAIARLGMAEIVKHFIDAHAATEAFNNEFKNMSELSLDKLNTQVDLLSLKLGMSASSMKNLATYSGAALNGLPGMNTGVTGAGLALNAATQATQMSDAFGSNPQQLITMMADVFKQTNQKVTDDSEDRFFDTVKQATIGIQALGGSANDVVSIFNLFKDSAAKLGMTGPGFTPGLYGIGNSLSNSMTSTQIAQYKSPDAMINAMLTTMAAPSVDMISDLTKDGKNMGGLDKFFKFRNLSNLPTKANTITPGGLGATKAYMSGDMSHADYLSYLGGGMPNSPLNNLKGSGPKRVPYATDLIYGQDLINSTYVANQRSKDQSIAAIKKVAPTVDLTKIQPSSPFLDNKMGVNIKPIAEADTAKAQVDAIGQAWMKASSNLDGLNSKIEAWQNNITQTTGKQINYQNALDLVNSQMSAFQVQVTKANRLVEDASLALEQYQASAVTPLQMQTEALNNSLSKVSNNLQNVQYNLSKYTDGLVTGEQASLNSLHSLDMYNKQLELLQLQYKQIGGQLDLNVYRRGFSTTVAPMAGISMEMQMQKAQQEQQAAQLKYDTTYGDDHYKMQQAARTQFEKKEMPLQDRLDGIRKNTTESDKLTISQHNLQNQQFNLSQEMYKVNRQVEIQQQGITNLQIAAQALQQSPHFRELQDEQMQLQIHLDATNRKLNLQNQNLTQWQNLMDDLKDQKQTLGDTFAALTGAKGNDPTAKIKSLVDMWATLPASMGGITDKQKNAMMTAINTAAGAQKDQQGKALSDYKSWWEKVYDITKQGFVGLFTGQTWGLIGSVIKTSVASLFSELGIPGGNAVGGGLAGAVTLGGAAYAAFTGGRFASNLAKKGVVSVAANAAGRIFPDTHAASGLGGGLATAGEFIEKKLPSNFISRFLKEEGAKLLGDDTDIAKWIRGFSPDVLDAFRLVKSFRTIAIGGALAAAGTVAAGPVGGLIGGWGGARYAQNTPFRDMPIIGKSISRMFPRVSGAAGEAAMGADRLAGALPEVGGIAKMGGALAGGVGLISRLMDVSGLGTLLKMGGSLGAKLAPVGTAAFAGIDAYHLVSGTGDKRAAIGGIGGLAAGAGIGGALGLLGGPLAPLTVPGGALLGAGIGQALGPMLAKLNWGDILHSVTDFFTKTLPSAILDGIKKLPSLALDGVKDSLKGMAFLLGLQLAIAVKIPFELGRKAVTEGWSLAKKAFSGAWDWIKSSISSLFTGAATGAASGGKWALSKLPGIMFDLFKSLPSLFISALGWVFGQLPTILLRAFKILPPMFANALWSAIENLPKIIYNAFKTIGSLLASAVKGLPGQIWDSFKSGLDIIPGFQTGISKVDNAMVAQLHPGEAVLNSAQANVWRQQQLNGGVIGQAQAVAGGGPGSIGTSTAVASGRGMILGATADGNSIDSTFNTIEDQWKDHLGKVQKTVKDHEDNVKRINSNTNDALISDNRKANAGSQEDTKKHYDHVQNDAKKGLDNTKDTVHHKLKDIQDTFANTHFHFPKIPTPQMPDMPTTSGMPGSGKPHPLDAITGAIKGQKLAVSDHDKQMKALQGMSSSDLVKMQSKYLFLADRYHTPQGDALQGMTSKLLEARQSRALAPSQAGGPDLDDNTLNKRRDKFQKDIQWYADSQNNFNKNNKQARDNDTAQQDKDQDDHSTVQQKKFSDTGDAITTIVQNKINDTKTTYSKGLDAILTVTTGWTGDVEKAYNKLATDLGLATVGKAANAKGGADGKHHPSINHDQGGLVKGGDIGSTRGHLIRVGEEGHDEMVIPLAPHRRHRAMSLIKQAHGRMGIPAYANGGAITERMAGTDTAYNTAKGAYMSARAMTSFANGGIEPGFTKAYAGVSKYGGPFGSGEGFIPISKLATGKFGLTITAGRTNHTTLVAGNGNVSDHSWGGAIDASNGTLTPQEDAWEHFWMKPQFGPVVKQLIWRDKVQRGDNLGSYVSGHTDHVHLAIQEKFAFNAALMAQILKNAEGGMAVGQLVANGGGSFAGGGNGSLTGIALPKDFSAPQVPKKLLNMGPVGKLLYKSLLANIDKQTKGLGKGPKGRQDTSWGGGVSSAALAAKFASINHVYAEHNSADGDWGGPTLPFDMIAALAESAGMPGVTMAQITKGESGQRPGATGIDPSGKTKGLGLWMITTGFNDALINSLGGETAMRNPILNAIAAANLWKSRGIAPWYGTEFVTGDDLHYKGSTSKLPGHAQGLDHVPWDNYAALLHKGEKVLPAGAAMSAKAQDKLDKDKKSNSIGVGKAVETALMAAIIRIKEKIEKIKDGIDGLNSAAAKAAAQQQLADLRAELANKRKIAGTSDGGYNYGITKALQLSGDKSGGEDTARLVASEKRKYQDIMKAAKNSKAYKAASARIKKDKKGIKKDQNRLKKLRKGGVTKKEHKRAVALKKDIKHKRTDIKKQKGIQKKILTKARNKYLAGAAHRGVNPKLIKAITGKKLSKKEASKYKKLEEKGHKTKGKGPDKKTTDKAKKAAQDKKDKAAQKRADALDKKATNRDKATQKARDEATKRAKTKDTQDAKNQAEAAKRRVKKDADSAKDKSQKAKDQAKAQGNRDKRQQKVDSRADKSANRNDQWQKRTTDLLQKIAAKDTVVNIHNTATGATLETERTGGGGTPRRK